jgi:phosphoglycolate phosphatase
MKPMTVKNDKIVLSFDLDFTLIINKEGILNSFKYALKKYNIPVIDDETLVKTIGVPLHQVFQDLVPTIKPSKLITAFREYYRTEGIYQVNLISGVREKLKELKDASFTLGVITSKREELAVRLLKYLKLDDLFDYIFGENDDIKTKLDPKLKDLLFDMYPTHEFVIIGDHPKDMKLSEMLNSPYIGVLTGTTSAEQLRRNDNRKHRILNSVKEITIDTIQALF